MATWATWYILISGVTYMTFYLRRRTRLKAETRLPSAFVLLGWFIWFPVLGIALSGILWQPSLAMVTFVCFWALCSSVVIFVAFLGSFIDYQA